MVFTPESWDIRDALGDLFHELAFADRRWIRLDSCLNDSFKAPQSMGDEVNCPVTVECPLESFSNILGVSKTKANDYLCAANLLEPHKFRNNVLTANRNRWEDLKNEYCLDIEVERVSGGRYLGKKLWLLRIGSLSSHNSYKTFDAKQQAKRFFVGGDGFEEG